MTATPRPAWVTTDDGRLIYICLSEGTITDTKQIVPDLVALDYNAAGVLSGIEIHLPEEMDR